MSTIVLAVGGTYLRLRDRLMSVEEKCRLLDELKDSNKSMSEDIIGLKHDIKTAREMREDWRQFLLRLQNLED
tara:strand:+ start:760 stop:978 length:219 start_codon:yes stop_codon:yes gene_type:complete